jgi:hypothetical protein
VGIPESKLSLAAKLKLFRAVCRAVLSRPKHTVPSPEWKISVVALVTPLNLPDPQSKPSLMFKGYGDKYFLSEVKFSKEHLVYSLPESKAERKLAQAAKARTISRSTPTDF